MTTEGYLGKWWFLLQKWRFLLQECQRVGMGRIWCGELDCYWATQVMMSVRPLQMQVWNSEGKSEINLMSIQK